MGLVRPQSLQLYIYIYNKKRIFAKYFFPDIDSTHFFSTVVTLQALSVTDCDPIVCVFGIVSWSSVSMEPRFDLAVYPGEERHTKGANLRLSVTMLQVN